MSRDLWTYIKWMLSEAPDDSDSELLIEPDHSDEEQEQDEQSVAAAVSGVVTPLGTDATYPNPSVGHKKPPAIAAGDSFGGARPPKKRKTN